MVPHDILSATKLAVHPFATTGIATNSVPFYFNIIHTFQSQIMSNIPSHRTRNLDGLMDRWSMMRNGEMLEVWGRETEEGASLQGVLHVEKGYPGAMKGSGRDIGQRIPERT